MHHHIRSTNATESFFRTVRRRTDQIDTFTRRYQLSLDCLGGDARHSVVKDRCLVSGFRRTVGGRKQPANDGWLGRSFFVFPVGLEVPAFMRGDGAQSSLKHRASLPLETILSADSAPDRPSLACGFGKVRDQAGRAFPKQIRDTMKDRLLQKQTIPLCRRRQAGEGG
jgi:hypothetical protein